MKQEYKTDEQLRDLFPHLTPDEFSQLEQNILRDGCTSPLCTWNGFIVDGHNRYNICTKHDLPFQTFTLGYDTKEEVISWMVDTQLGRRNLTSMQKIEITEKYRPVYEQKAEDKKGGFKGNQYTSGSVPKSAPDQKEKTRDVLANLAGVGHDTYTKAKWILDYERKKGEELTPEEKEYIAKARSGEMKINTAYKKLFNSESTGNKSTSKGESKGSGSRKQDTKSSNAEPSTNSEPEIEPTPEPTSELEVDTDQEQEQELEPEPSIDPAQESVSKLKTSSPSSKWKLATKVCTKCENEKPLDDFYEGHDKCKECEISQNSDKPSKKSLASQSENDKLLQEIRDEIKTPKNAEDYMDADREIVWTEFVCNDLVRQLDRKLFSLHNISRKMSVEQIVKTVSILNQHIQEIEGLKNRFKIKPKETDINEKLTKTCNDISNVVNNLTDTTACDKLLNQLESFNEKLLLIKKDAYGRRKKIYLEMPKDSELTCRIKEEEGNSTFKQITFYLVKTGKGISNDAPVLSLERYVLTDTNTKNNYLEDTLDRCKRSTNLSDKEFKLLCTTVYEKQKIEIKIAEEEKLREDEITKRLEELREKQRQTDRNNILTNAKRADPEVKDMMRSIVRQGFRELTRKHHPDVSGDDGHKMVLVGQAKEVLDAII